MSRRSQSQNPSTSNRKRSQTLTQTALDEYGCEREVESMKELVDNCVRYVLYRSRNNWPIRKPDIQKHVLHHGRNFNKIMARAAKVLKEVYGYDFYLIKDSSNIKQYLVSNALAHKSFDTNADATASNLPPADTNKILIMLVLAHIFMSNNNVTEASLFAFLHSIRISPDENHKLFGNVKEFVTSTMVKQRYLMLETDQITRRAFYSWGPRSEHEISKQAVLNFVCKMYRDRMPKSWTIQYERACKQIENSEKSQAAVVVDDDEGESD